ncbi:MAG: DUF6580 family putative transport protein [Ferruginibacter sp.]
MPSLRKDVVIAAFLILVAASMKAITYPHSISPIIAISLFSGAMISDKRLTFLLPLLAMLISDIILEVFQIAPGFYGLGQIGNYISLLFVTLLGFMVRKINVLTVTGFSVLSSLLFYLLSNTNCFLFDTTGFYGTGLNGYLYCMELGLPFIRNGLAIDLVFAWLLFGSYVLVFKQSTTARSVNKTAH